MSISHPQKKQAAVMPVFHTKTIQSILDPVAQQVSRGGLFRCVCRVTPHPTNRPFPFCISGGNCLYTRARSVLLYSFYLPALLYTASSYTVKIPHIALYETRPPLNVGRFRDMQKSAFSAKIVLQSIVVWILHRAFCENLYRTICCPPQHTRQTCLYKHMERV